MAKFNPQDPKQMRLATGLFIVFLVGVFVFVRMTAKEERADKPRVERSIQGIGLMSPLKVAMVKERDLRVRVNILLDFDEYYIFSNYKEINARISEILFLWSGLTVQDLETMKSQEAINHFLRRAHGLPDDHPIKGSPYIGEDPWPRLFNMMKARLLMLGGGRNIYDGVAYYSYGDNRMVIEGGLSKIFMKELKKFLKTRNDARRFHNNFLIFVDDTKGIRNLSAEDKALIRELSN